MDLDMPHLDHRLTAYAEVVEAFRSPKLSTLIHDGTEAFRAGTVLRIEGPGHQQRRRVMGRLLRGDGDEWFRSQVLMPTIRRNLQAVIARTGGSALPETDMVVFTRQAFFQLAASLIGLCGVDGPEAADELRRFCEPINLAMRSWYLRGDRAKILAGGVSVKNEFRDRYYRPAYELHVALVEAVDRGELEPASLPHDLLNLVVNQADPEWASDPDLPLREAITDIINAGTFSSSSTLVHAVHNCLTWLDDHPEDRWLQRDPGFLMGVVTETLRLHPAAPMFFRTALDKVTLKSGRVIRAGESVGIMVLEANRDTDVFGPDAACFRPGRVTPSGVYPYGVAFGTGRHMCFGLPIILGSDGVNGSHVQLLKAFLEAGMTHHPSIPPTKNLDSQLDVWGSYPVVFDSQPSPRPREGRVA
jgi:cytochrome P450